MEFIKGAIIGVVAGTWIGVMNNEMICEVIKNGKKEIRKMKRKFNV